MAGLGRRLILLFVTFITVWNLVDFSTAPFDPFREQIELSTQKVTSSQYYQDYITPLESKYTPLVTKAKTQYVVPGFVGATNFASDQYRILLSKYVKLITDSVNSSPVHKYVLKATEYSDKFIVYVKEYSQIGFESAAIGSVKAIEASKFGSAYASEHLKIIYEKLLVFKQIVRTNIKESLIPALNKAKVKTVEYSIIAYQNTHKFFSALYEATKSFFNDRVIPFYQSNITPFYEQKVLPFYATKVNPFLQSVYSKYLKHHYETYLLPVVVKAQTYSELVKIQTSKYYNLFRVQQILNGSQSLLKSSYKELNERFSQLKAKSPEKIQIVDKPTRNYIVSSDKHKELESTESTESTETSESTEVELTTETETEIETVQETVQETEAQETVGTDNVDFKSNDELQVEVTLGDEIANWEDFINETVQNIFKNLDRSVETLEGALLDSIKPEITKRLQYLSNKLQEDYSETNKAIYHIDSHPAALENGEPIELDKDGKLIDHRISRQEFRDILAANKDFAVNESENINEILSSKVKELEKEIDSEREIIVDIYEEFAEVAITEFSKKMMYSTYSSSFNKISDAESLENDSENFNDWKQYIKVKNSLIQRRDDLINKQADLSALNAFILDIQGTLKAFIHESGNYYSVLRAKANIEFQEREAREASIASDTDAPIKTTILKIETKTIDDISDVVSPSPESEQKETTENSVEEPVGIVEEDIIEPETVQQEIKDEENDVPAAEITTEANFEETEEVLEPVEEQPVPVPVTEDQESEEEEQEEQEEQEELETPETPETPEEKYENVNVHKEDEEVIIEEEDIVEHQPDKEEV